MTNERKPLIGITVNYIIKDKAGPALSVETRQKLNTTYVTAVARAGGLPVLLPVCELYAGDGEILERLDGILFSGGDDVDPACYNQPPDPQLGKLCKERDKQELFLLQRALQDKTMPILGVCRGCQLLNVALGGTLIQHIDTEKFGVHTFDGQPMSAVTHSVTVRKGSLLERIVGENPEVNSFHHQSADKLGKGVECVATDSHGIIEGIEYPQRAAFTLGVQWHPEGLCEEYKIHQNIFDEFVRAAVAKQAE